VRVTPNAVRSEVGRDVHLVRVELVRDRRDHLEWISVSHAQAAAAGFQAPVERGQGSG
jgi:hypothetical protein